MRRMFALFLWRGEVVSPPCLPKLVGYLVPIPFWGKGGMNFPGIRHRCIRGVSVSKSVASPGCLA
jgi:hypothetical protein